MASCIKAKKTLGQQADSSGIGDWYHWDDIGFGWLFSRVDL